MRELHNGKPFEIVAISTERKAYFKREHKLTFPRVSDIVIQILLKFRTRQHCIMLVCHYDF
jgi:hypothetical protein